MTKANGGDKYCKQQFLIILIVLNQIKKKKEKTETETLTNCLKHHFAKQSLSIE